MTVVASPTHTVDELLDTIVKETLNARYAWGNYRLLFASHDHIDVLNATAPDLFGWIQGLIAESVFMTIARLVDRSSTGRGAVAQPNASLERLLQSTEWDVSDRSRWDRYSAQLTAVRDACKGSNLYRHKRLGHLDLAVALKLEPIPMVTIADVDAALDAIETFVGAIHTELRPDHSQSFRFLNAEDHVNPLLRKLTNRASKGKPNAVSTIICVEGEGAHLECAFCEASTIVYMRSDEIPEPTFLKHWHFNQCSGVIGTETVTVEMRGRDGELRRSTFSLKRHE